MMYGCISGSYSDSAGIEVIRRDIASYITERDGGIPSDFHNVFMSSGASDAIKVISRILMPEFTIVIFIHYKSVSQFSICSG